MMIVVKINRKEEVCGLILGIMLTYLEESVCGPRLSPLPVT